MSIAKQASVTRRAVLKTTGILAASAVIGGSQLLAQDPSSINEDVDPLLTLWYKRPARVWIEALPLGNGRLGAMVFGDPSLERIGLNEDTLWSGGPYTPEVDVSEEDLKRVRQLVFEGKYEEAQRLEDEVFFGPIHTQSSYQTLGELQLTFSGHDSFTNYRRELNLGEGIASTAYSVGDTVYRREALATVAENVIAIHLAASKPGQLTFQATITSPQQHEISAVSQDTLRMSGQNGDLMDRTVKLVDHDLTFVSLVRVEAKGGTTSAVDDKLSISGADEATLYITAATSYKRYDDVSGNPDALCRAAIEKAAQRSFPSMRSEHVIAHKAIFSRVRLELPLTTISYLSTDARIKLYAGGNDPALAALYFQFGRYLLMSCSREGGQPVNLQGMWNEDLSAAWGGKYTVNINTEMNYWPVYVANLAECDQPLFDLVRDLSIRGAHTAQVMYHARGWVCHHNTDLWRATAPIDGAFYGLWPTGGAWLCNTLYQRYAFFADRRRLAELYPIMKGAAQFFLDALQEEPTHRWLVTCPSMSPEHDYQKGLTTTAGPTMDNAILHELFSNCAEAANLLHDSTFAQECLKTRDRLPPFQVGHAGQLQEWLQDLDTTAPEIAHRHMSPLYGLFPGSQITPRDTKFANAARILMDMRGNPVDGMGWAMAWRACLWARLLDADMAHDVLAQLISSRTELNMFDQPRVQLDGNFGGCAAIAEMLLQSHAGEVHLLPALPVVWRTGQVSGLRARGGFEVGMAWEDGELIRATISSETGGTCTLRYLEKTISIKVHPGSKVLLKGSNLT